MAFPSASRTSVGTGTRRVQWRESGRQRLIGQEGAAANFCNLEKNFLRRINDAEHLKSDVIGTASIFSQLDESATCRLGRLRGERLLYLTRIHLAPQSVGADHQDITFMEQ